MASRCARRHRQRIPLDGPRARSARAADCLAKTLWWLRLRLRLGAEDTICCAPRLQDFQRPLGEKLAFPFLVTNWVRQIIEQSEVRVHRLEVLWIALANVPVERTEHCCWRRNYRGLPGEHSGH